MRPRPHGHAPATRTSLHPCPRTSSDSDLLRPVAIEGERTIFCISYVPLSIAALAMAAFARSMLDGAACWLDVSYCRSANGVPIHPLGLGVPASRFEELMPTPRLRTDFVASGGASHHGRQGASGEASRLDSYRSSFFVVTGRGAAGWDTMPLYETIASGGALPYVL